MIITRLVSIIGKTIIGAVRIATSKDKLTGLLGISLYRNALHLILNSAVLSLTVFFFWVVAARLYLAEGVGFASAAISAVGWLAAQSVVAISVISILFRRHYRTTLTKVSQ